MDMTDCLKKGERLTMSGPLCVNRVSDFRRKVLYQGTDTGIDPERVLSYYRTCRTLSFGSKKRNLDFIDELRDMGAYIQMNADSIIGEDGFMIKRFCKKVIKEEMLDFVGSDGHDMARRTPHIGKCYDKIEKMMGTDYADMIFISNPECIINNERF